jgi:hypothetical protein
MATAQKCAVSRPRCAASAPCVARMSLGSGAARVSAPLPAFKWVAAARPARGGVAVVRASEVKYEIAPEGARDYAPLLGIFGLVGYIYNKVSLNAPQLLKTIAWYQIFVAGIALLFRRAELDNLSSVVAPAILAVYSLNLAQISYMDAAVALFGYYISERLEGPFWAWIATLAGAIYAGYPSHWYVAAIGLVAATRLVRGGQDNRIPVLTVPTLAAVAYSFWKDLTPTFTIALMIGQIVASGIKYAENVSDSS